MNLGGTIVKKCKKNSNKCCVVCVSLSYFVLCSFLSFHDIISDKICIFCRKLNLLYTSGHLSTEGVLELSMVLD